MTFTLPRIDLMDNYLKYARKCISSIGYNYPSRYESAFIGNLHYCAYLTGNAEKL